MPLLTSPLRRGLPVASSGEDLRARADEQIALRAQDSTAIGRGFQAGAAHMYAGDLADQMAEAQAAQDTAAFEALRGQHEAIQDYAGRAGPRVSSLRDIGGLDDALEFAGGQLGQAGATMLPVMAGALAARTPLRGGLLTGAAARATPYLGAAAPAYQLERDEALTAQYADPELAAKPLDERLAAARNKALVNAALESIVPGTLARGLGRVTDSPLRTIGRSMVDEGLTEGAQETTGILAQETLRNDGDLGKALPTLGTGDNLQQVVDSIAGGAIGGGGMATPVAASQAAANALDTAATKSAEAGKAVVDAGKSAVEAGKAKTEDLRDWADRALEDTKDDDNALVQLLNNRGKSEDEFMPEDVATRELDEAASRGDLLGVQAAMDRQQADRPDFYKRVAEAVGSLKDAPAALKGLAQRVMEGTGTENDAARLLGEAHGYQAARVAKTAAARGIVAVDEAATGFKTLMDDLKARGKRNEQEAGEEVDQRGMNQRMVETLFSELRPEMQQDAKVRGKLEPMAKLFRELDVNVKGDGAGTAEYDTMARLAPALSMFKDASKVVPKGLRKIYEDVTRAQSEAQAEDSWLSQNLVPQFANAPKARLEVARIIDRASLGEELGTGEMGLLKRAFGSAGATQTMLRHYKLQMPLLRRTRQEREEQAEDVVEVDEDKGFTEREAEFTTHYAGSNRKPFLNMRRKGERAPAQARARELREAGERAEVVSLADVAREQGLDIKAEAQRVRDDYAARLETGETTPEEDVLHEAVTDDVELLRAHQVVRTSKKDNASDTLMRSHELKTKAAVLAKQAANPKASPEARAAAKQTLFTVTRAGGAKQTLSAESLWKYFGDRQQKEKGERGIIEGEGKGDAARAEDLFSQAIAELALDPEVESIDFPQDLLIDRATGVRMTQQQVDAKLKPNERYQRANRVAAKLKARRADDVQAMKALDDQDFRARAQAVARDAERPVADRLDTLAQAVPSSTELENTRGPRRAYLKRRGQMAREVMENLVNKLVPRPDTRDTSTGVAEVEAMADAEGQARREVQAQQAYVQDLRNVIEGHDELSHMLERAEARLAELEDKINPPRTYDETTGESLVPGTKEAAGNASGVKSAARKAQRAADAVRENGLDESEVKAPRPVPNPPVRTTKKNEQEIVFDEDFQFDDEIELLDFDGVENNGSGDSSASIEAINRQRDERALGRTRMLIDRDGTVRELSGVDAVDTHARKGQIIVQRNIGKDEWTILSQGDDVSSELAQGRLNAARSKFNTQQRRSSGGISRDLKNKIAGEMKRISGLKTAADVRKKLSFVKAKEIGGASGEFDPATGAIRIAMSALDPLSVYYHEALHDFVNDLQNSPQGRELRKALFKAGEMPHVRAQLNELLKDHPKALAAIEADPEERVAYMFQFWSLGQHTGKPVLQVRSPEAQNALGRLARWIRQLFNVVSQNERAQAVFEKLYEGGFSDRSLLGEVIQDMKLDTLGDKLERVAGPLAGVYNNLLLTATDRLRDFGVDSLDQVADMFATEPGRERGELRFLQRRAQTAGKFLNETAKLFKDSTAAERATALRNLQAMKPPSSPLEKSVRKLLDDLWQYQVDAGVQRLNPKTKQWEDLKPVKNYFPRRWDASKILNNEEEFRQLLFKHGKMQPDAQLQLIQALTHGDGQIELADNEYHVGYTPFARHVQDRQLKFIDETNAAEFAKYQVQDLADVLKGYVFQAVHRGEFAKDFGNDGKVLSDALGEAATKLDAKQVAAAGNAIKAMVGTLGADINPRLKDVMSAAVTAENVILLPLTMFSQLIDALGVGLRAQAPEEAWRAFKRGMGDFAKAVAKRQLVEGDYDTEMAKTLGLIDEENMFEAMGQAHAGAFMSKFARDVNRKFFRWNGMEQWNRSMRVSAMVAGERFIQRELGNSRYMNELGLEKSDVMVKPDGRLAVTAEQMMELGATKKQAEAREQKIQEALFRFVDGAVLRPNAAQRPVWGSDPHWMLLFHLKQFTFSFQKTILARVNNEFEHGKMMPAAILAAYVPVTIASGLAKSALTGQTIGDGSLWDMLNYGVMRSGILGTQTFSSDAVGDLQRGQLPGSSLLGPAMEHLWTASRWLVGDPKTDAGAVLDRSVPFARYF